MDGYDEGQEQAQFYGQDAGSQDAGDGGQYAGDGGADAGDAGRDAGDAGRDAGDGGSDAGLPKCFQAYCDNPNHGYWWGSNAFATWDEAVNDAAEHDIREHRSVQTAKVHNICA